MTRKRRRSARATRAASAAWSVPAVLAYRLPMLGQMAMDPTPARRREARRMVTEKAEALIEGALAMQLELLARARSFWLGALTGGVGERWLARACASVLEAGAAPATRRVKANARRLGRRKRL